jgi:hypothetical protein
MVGVKHLTKSMYLMMALNSSAAANGGLLLRVLANWRKLIRFLNKYHIHGNLYIAENPR